MLQLDENLPKIIRRETARALVGSLQASGLVARVHSTDDCIDVLRYCRRNGLSICPRGGGYSYGDAVLNSGNLLLDTSGMNQILRFDEVSGQIVAQPGVSVIDIQKMTLPHNLVLASVPSEPTITIAGGAAANVNGKDGWRVGNFGDQVVKLKLMTAAGDIVTASRSKNSDVFFAAIGGLGLLGIIVELTLRLQRIPSPFIHVSRQPIANLSELLSRLMEVKVQSDHAVAWLDTCATGRNLGRGVIHSTRWLHRSGKEDLHESLARSMRRLDSRRAHAATMAPIVSAVVSLMMQFQTLSIGMFNKLYFWYSKMRYRLGSADNDESIIRYSFDASFMIPSASAVCGPNGYTIQLTVPDTNALDTITRMLKVCQDSPCFPAKLIMRLHRQDQHLVSFCQDGYSLNFEFHPKKRHVRKMKEFADQLIDIAIANGGKVHLAKDHILSRTQFQRLYPRYVELLDVKRRLDPEERFQSDIYRRLMRDTTVSSAPSNVPLPAKTSSTDRATRSI